MTTSSRFNRPITWNREIEELVKELVSSVMYGTVTIIIQDGRIIQVDKNEKFRIKGHQDGSGI